MGLEPLLGNTAAIGRTLAVGTLQGRWTLEDLDQPAPYYEQQERDRARSATPSPPGRGLPTLRYPDAGTMHRPRNLAREWIEANPREWVELMEQHLDAEPPRRPTPQVIRATSQPIDAIP